jgi:hypothetical protein
MTKRFSQLAGLAALALAVAGPAFADIKVNDNLAFSGYIVGLADSKSVDQQESSASMDLQATKLLAKMNFAPVSGALSFYSGPNNDPVVLDAYFTYDLGKGTTVTGGKFLSWLGYEAFDPVNMITITYAWQTPGIPGYHSGVKIETSSDSFAAGVAVLDSNDSALSYGPYNGNVIKGDGDMDNGLGAEAYISFKTSALTSFLGLAYNQYEDDNNTVSIDSFKEKSMSIDFWTQYVTGKWTFAGEYAYWTSEYTTRTLATPSVVLEDDSDNAYFYGVWAKFAASDKLALVGRYAAGRNDASDLYGRIGLKPEYTKATFSPIFTLTANLEIVAEATFTKYDEYYETFVAPGSRFNVAIDDATYFGVQARFKF